MTQTDITLFIPQRPPFVMVDEVLQAEKAISKTIFLVTEENIFTQNGVFTEPGLVENMAQTAAAGTGYRYYHSGEVVPVGFIGAIKNLKINLLPKIGQTLETEIEVTHTVLNVHVVVAKVHVLGELAASCEMKIFEQTTTP